MAIRLDAQHIKSVIMLMVVCFLPIGCVASSSTSHKEAEPIAGIKIEEVTSIPSNIILEKTWSVRGYPHLITYVNYSQLHSLEYPIEKEWLYADEYGFFRVPNGSGPRVEGGGPGASVSVSESGYYAAIKNYYEHSTQDNRDYITNATLLVFRLDKSFFREISFPFTYYDFIYGLIWIQNKLYIIQGVFDYHFYIYNLEDNSWTELKRLYIPKSLVGTDDVLVSPDGRYLAQKYCLKLNYGGNCVKAGVAVSDLRIIQQVLVMDEFFDWGWDGNTLTIPSKKEGKFHRIQMP